MNELLYVLQEQLRITYPSVEVMFVSVPDQRLGAGSAIVAYDPYTKRRARVFLTDTELHTRLLAPSLNAFGLAWDMRTLLDDNGTEIEPQFLHAMGLIK